MQFDIHFEVRGSGRATLPRSREVDSDDNHENARVTDLASHEKTQNAQKIAWLRVWTVWILRRVPDKENLNTEAQREQRKGEKETAGRAKKKHKKHKKSRGCGCGRFEF